jgi:hypothetical protein
LSEALGFAKPTSEPEPHSNHKFASILSNSTFATEGIAH